MDINLSKWLKDGLSLRHLSEAEMNGLVYHPRHGGLCRRFVKFLTESTLCSKRYPNIYALEEYEDAKREFESKEDLMRNLLAKLETQLRVIKNIQSSLDYTTEKHNCIVRIEDLLTTTTMAFENMASHSSIALIETGHNLENPKYLGNLSLEILYSTFLKCYKRSHTSSDKITRREYTNVNEKFDILTQKVKIVHNLTSKLLTSVLIKAKNSHGDVNLTRTSINSLKALKLPKCEEIECDFDREERELYDNRTRLLKELRHTNQQVNDLAQRANHLKAEMKERYKIELGKDLMLLQSIQELEAIIFAS